MTNLKGNFSFGKIFHFFEVPNLVQTATLSYSSIAKNFIDWSLSQSGFKNGTSFHNMYCNVFFISYTNKFEQKFTSYEGNKSILDMVNDFVKML